MGYPLQILPFEIIHCRMHLEYHRSLYPPAPLLNLVLSVLQMHLKIQSQQHRNKKSHQNDSPLSDLELSVRLLVAYYEPWQSVGVLSWDLLQSVDRCIEEITEYLDIVRSCEPVRSPRFSQ